MNYWSGGGVRSRRRPSPFDVMRCVLAISKSEDDLRRTTILNIHSNVVTRIARSSLMVKLLNVVFKGCGAAEPRPEPYRVAWVDKTSMAVSRCLVSFYQSTPYQEQISCDILSMDVLSIFLGRRWLFDKSATHFGRANTSLCAWW